MLRKKIAIITGLISIIINLHGQSNWQFIGPYSDNITADNGFETSQMTSIVADPNNSQHLFACSIYGGLWESTDNCTTWNNISTNSTGLQGIGSMIFINSTQLLVSNFHSKTYVCSDIKMNYSNQVSIYNFQSQTWQNLAPLPTGSSKYIIQSVAVHPADPSVYYAGTSLGLFRYSNGNWTHIVQNCFVEKIVFVKKSFGTDYFCYIAGSNASTDPVINTSIPSGTSMLMESYDSGNSVFTSLSSNISLPAGYSTSHSKICIGPTYGNGVDLFLLTQLMEGKYLGKRALHKISINKSSSTSSYLSCNQLTEYFYTAYINNTTINASESSGRLAIAYDPLHNYVWLGGVYVRYFELATNQLSGFVKPANHTRNDYIHADQHEFLIRNNGGYEILIANDAGIARASLNTSPPVSSNISFERKCDKLNVCLVNGFSGSEQHPNLYLIGGQDIINTDIYEYNDTTLRGKNKYTHETWENDGGLIYKHDDLRMILDRSSYDPYYDISTNQGKNTYTISEGFYDTYSNLNNPSLPFSANAGANWAEKGARFGRQRFSDDPYRPGRIYAVGLGAWPQLHQFDFNANKFAIKVRFLTPTFSDISFHQTLMDVSFSPQTPNSMHIVTDGRYYPNDGESSAGRVYKYIGANLDQAYGTYAYYDINNNPQWQDITPNYTNFSSVGGDGEGAANISVADLGKVSYMAVETSPWDKDVIYVAGAIDYVGQNKKIKVLRYQGTWTDYSNGIPEDEVVTDMTMDHYSKDALYLATDMAVYYRDGNMSSWIPYNVGLPFIQSNQIEVNYNSNSIRVGTFGRGIYKSDLVCPSQTNLPLTGSIAPNIYEAQNITCSGVTTMANSPTVFRGTNSITLNPGFSASGTSSSNRYFFGLIHGCNSSRSTSPNLHRASANEQLNEIAKEMPRDNIDIYPNPNQGTFTVVIADDIESYLEVHDTNGKSVFNTIINEQKTELNLSHLETGVYVIQISNKATVNNHKVVIIK